MTEERPSRATNDAATEAKWHQPQPASLPRPTYWPAVMALGITFVFWGVASTWIISAVGLALFASSLAGWIGELRDEASRGVE